MNSITLDSNDCTTIAAMAKHVAPKAEVRYYLIGVALECTASGWLALATDGHVMTIGRLNNAATDAAPIGTQIIIPRDVALGMAKQFGAVLTFDTSLGPRTLRHGDVTVTLDPNAATWTFPDWRRVVPTTISGEVAQFDPAVTGPAHAVALDMYNAWRKPRDRKQTLFAHLAHNGKGASCITFADVDLYAIVMPMRSDPIPRPCWVLADTRAAEVDVDEAQAA